MAAFNGLGMNMGNLWRLSNAVMRSISPENMTGKKGKGGMAVEGTDSKSAAGLGQGLKINPFINIKAGETAVLADITGPGAMQYIWMTPAGHFRFSILRRTRCQSRYPPLNAAWMGPKGYCRLRSCASNNQMIRRCAPHDTGATHRTTVRARANSLYAGYQSRKWPAQRSRY